MERKLRKSYLLMFLIFIMTLIVIILIGTWVSSTYVQPSMASFQHTANQLLTEGLNETNIQEIVQDGGGIMLVHEDGQVEQLAGLCTWKKNVMSKSEFTQILTNASNPYSKYKYSIAYDEENYVWLIVSFPVPMRFQILFTSNPTSKEYVKSLLFYIAFGVSLTVTLFFLAWCYARKSAKTYSKPLKNVCDSVREIARGNYEVKEQEIAIEEYECLQHDVMQLALLLQEEKKNTKQIEDSKRQMLLDISHDLRNPIATILGYSESLYREEGLSEKERENYIEVIYRNSMRAHTLMNELFEYTRLDAPTLKVELEPVDICEFLREFAASYVPDLESAGFESEFDIPEEEQNVMLDKRLMERALGNIVHNSLRYNKAGTKLTLSINIVDEEAVIHIRDNGIGIHKSFCESIFLPFTRADKARNSKIGGSGLGLSISKKIIEAFSGSIRLESDINQGCDFVITLPCRLGVT